MKLFDIWYCRRKMRFLFFILEGKKIVFHDQNFPAPSGKQSLAKFSRIKWQRFIMFKLNDRDLGTE